MTANILSSELSNIIQEAKKKHSELKNGAEKSLHDLKNLTVTSESQLAADLQRRIHFIDPFLAACKSKTAKLALHGATSLQRLVVIHGLSKERVRDVLDAFSDCSSISTDVQLKILQTLPHFLQSYTNELHGDSLALALQVCSILQQSKTSAVSSTALATFQQLVSSVFEKVVVEDELNEDGLPLHEVTINKGTILIKPAANDASRQQLFLDLCLLMDSQKPQFVRNAQLSQAFGLELIATILTDYQVVFKGHPEQMQILRDRLMPMVTRLLSERTSFPISVRTMRIFCIVLRDHLKALALDCEVALGLLDHLLESDGTALWRRAIGMEAFRIIYTTPNLVVEIFSRFDAKPNRKNILQNSLAAFVRLASEKPSLIGISQQSTHPVGPASTKDTSQEQVVLEAGGITGVISSDVGVREAPVSGISSQWSSLKTPCLDLMDKSDAPTVPETYSYSLVLTCISSLSESLARTVLPLVASHDTRSREQATEPLEVDVKSPTVLDETIIGNVESDVQMSSNGNLTANAPSKDSQSIHPKLKTITGLVDECWPAVLATCSTFLYAALDADYYRNLVRSFQYFTQVAGLLGLPTPRDAFLTTLAKSAVPSSVFKAEVMSTPSLASDNSQFPFNNKTQVIPEGKADSMERSRRNSIDSSRAYLTPRNLMCMRALINLAIALGPTLDASWSIVIETLQKADLVLASSGSSRARAFRSEPHGLDRQESDTMDTIQASLATEVAAVNTAVTRLFQSTEDYSPHAFVTLIDSFCYLINSGGGREDKSDQVPSSPTSSLGHRKPITYSGMSVHAQAQPQHYQFAISKLGEVARINLHRFAELDPDQSGWDALVAELSCVAASPHLHASARAIAVEVLGNVAVGIAVVTSGEDKGVRGNTQRRALSALQSLVRALRQSQLETHNVSPMDLEVHKSVLDSVHSLLQQCGEVLIDGWDVIIDIIDKSFYPGTENKELETSAPDGDGEEAFRVQNPIPPKLCRSAFASAQLICSDFLSSLSQENLLATTGILSRFCSQSEDLNIALTTITLFWNVSDFLQHRLVSFELPDVAQGDQKNAILATLLTTSAHQGSTTSLWMLLLLRLTRITSDKRADVRNGAIHTVLRILDNCGDHLSSEVWRVCIRNIMFESIRVNIKQQNHSRSNPSDYSLQEIEALTATSKIILEGLSDLISAYLEAIVNIPAFIELWRSLLGHFKSYTDCASYELSHIVFTALANILAANENNKQIGNTAIAMAASLWADNLPVSTDYSGKFDAAGGERAFVAYTESIKHIYRLMEPEVNAKQTKLILDNLYECLTSSKQAAYSSDVENMTKLQSKVLEMCNMLRSDIEGVPSMLVSFLSSLIVLPYNNEPSVVPKDRLSYIALAKESSNQLKATVQLYKVRAEIHQSGAVARAVSAFAKAISLKYVWQQQGAQPWLWRKATSMAIAVLEQTIPSYGNKDLGTKLLTDFWSAVVRITSGICSPNMDSPPEMKALLDDETFDLEAITRLRDLVSPFLNSDGMVGNLRSDLVMAFFDASLVHAYGHYGESGFPDFETAPPFKGLYHIRFGRTLDPGFNPRLRICYFSLDELFSMVRSERMLDDLPLQSATSQLARATFSILILRCALPLRMYIADQPLRGRLPTPMSQRLELIHILRRVKDLRCDPVAVPEWTDEMTEGMDGEESGLKIKLRIQDPGRRHLEWLLPLVNRAMTWAKRDNEVWQALQDVMEVAIGSASSKP